MTFDYQKIAPQGTPETVRRQMRVGDIFENAAVCGSCNEYIRSTNRHDFHTCSCGNVSVDGGSHYVKRSFMTPNFTDFITEYE